MRVRHKGKVTDIYINQLADGRLMHSNSWIEADGWATDAYMFAVTYDEGADPAEPERQFIAYGSALRRGATSYFSSLSKLSVIRKEEAGRMELWMDGQPRMKATLRSTKRPSSVAVNGEKATVVYARSSVKVDCKQQ